MMHGTDSNFKRHSIEFSAETNWHNLCSLWDGRVVYDSVPAKLKNRFLRHKLVSFFKLCTVRLIAFCDIFVSEFSNETDRWDDKSTVICGRGRRGALFLEFRRNYGQCHQMHQKCYLVCFMHNSREQSFWEDNSFVKGIMIYRQTDASIKNRPGLISCGPDKQNIPLFYLTQF